MTEEQLAIEAEYGIGGTLLAELSRRDDCRYGLRGVLLERDDELWRVTGSSWDRHGRLELALVPEASWEAYQQWQREQEDSDGCVSFGKLLTMEFPDYLCHFPATGFILRSPWPVVCDCWLPDGEAAP